MDIDDQIAVMEYFSCGGEVEYCEIGTNSGNLLIILYGIGNYINIELLLKPTHL